MKHEWIYDVPFPHIIASDRFTFLLVTHEAESSDQKHTLVIEWDKCLTVRFGAPGEEECGQWELFGDGTGEGTALEIEDSDWMAQILALPDFHYLADEGEPEFHHYALLFTDMTFECIARSFTEQVYQSSILDTVVEVAQLIRRRGL